jgi:hypothetical protein
VEDGTDKLAGLGDVPLGEADILECHLELLEADTIVFVDVLARRGQAAVAEVAVGGLVEEVHVLPLLLRCAGDEVVEDVEVALARGRAGDTGALEVVVKRLDTADAAAVGELELGVLAETGSIGIEECASAAERLEDKFRGGDLVHELGAFLARVGHGQFKDGLDCKPSAFRLAATRLAAAAYVRQGKERPRPTADAA